ncbi:MAG TPA: hypothetical protein VFO19_20855 [Vicinamibacterales bacterium]|nr:hypothetical protein [Vicinamibacterales bacterium]
MGEVLFKAPQCCPYCSSDKVVKNPKQQETAYWRCDNCGQLWHPDRPPRKFAPRSWHR